MSGIDELQIDVTDAEILADLCWPGPPPGDWTWTGRRSSPATSSASGSRLRLDRVASEARFEQREGMVGLGRDREVLATRFERR